MVVVYPVGVPAVLVWWLFKHRHALASPDRESIPEVQSCSDLWQPYKRDKFYYEASGTRGLVRGGRGGVET